MPRNPDTCQNAPGSRLAVLVALVVLALHRGLPHATRCRRDGLSCSRYATAAIRAHGAVRGLGEALVYVSSCGVNTPPDARTVTPAVTVREPVAA